MTPVTHALTAALLHFLWQGIGVGLLLWITLFLLGKRSANTRYAASCIALGVLALAPLITLMTGWMVYQPEPQVSEMVGAVSLGRSTSLLLSAGNVVPGAVESLKRIDVWILPLWVIGVLIFTVRLAWAGGHASSLRRHGEEADAAIRSLVASLAERTGVKRSIRVLMSTVAEMPSVVGWIRPVVLLPAAVVVGLTPQQLEAVIAHELAHIRRQDYFVNILQTVVETLLFYHPAVWWVSSRIRHEREICCDDLAVDVCGDAVCYARALAHIEKLRVFKPSLAMGSAKGPLFHRIQRLLAGEACEQAPSRRACAVGLLAAILCLGLNLTWASSTRRGEFSSPLQAAAFQASPFQVRPLVVPPPLAPPLPISTLVPPSAPLPPPTPPYPQSTELRELGALELAQSRWVLLRGELAIVHGSPADEAAAKAVQRTTPGDLLWFQLEGKTYVTQDKATLDRLQALSGERPLNLLMPQVVEPGIDPDRLRGIAEQVRLQAETLELRNRLQRSEFLLQKGLVSTRQIEEAQVQLERGQKKLEELQMNLQVRQAQAPGLSPEGTSDDVVLEQVPPVRQARAQMDGAKARLDRAIQLAERGLLAKSDLDATTSAYKVTEAQYAAALDEARNRQGILAQRRSELQIARQQGQPDEARRQLEEVQKRLVEQQKLQGEILRDRDKLGRDVEEIQKSLVEQKKLQQEILQRRAELERELLEIQKRIVDQERTLRLRDELNQSDDRVRELLEDAVRSGKAR